MSNKSLSFPSSETRGAKRARRGARRQLLAEILHVLTSSWFTRRVSKAQRRARWSKDLTARGRAVCRMVGWAPQFGAEPRR